MVIMMNAENFIMIVSLLSQMFNDTVAMKQMWWLWWNPKTFHNDCIAAAAGVNDAIAMKEIWWSWWNPKAVHNDWIAVAADDNDTIAMKKIWWLWWRPKKLFIMIVSLLSQMVMARSRLKKHGGDDEIQKLFIMIVSLLSQMITTRSRWKKYDD